MVHVFAIFQRALRARTPRSSILMLALLHQISNRQSNPTSFRHEHPHSDSMPFSNLEHQSIGRPRHADTQCPITGASNGRMQCHLHVADWPPGLDEVWSGSLPTSLSCPTLDPCWRGSGLRSPETAKPLKWAWLSAASNRQASPSSTRPPPCTEECHPTKCEYACFLELRKRRRVPDTRVTLT